MPRVAPDWSEKCWMFRLVARCAGRYGAAR
ncbi:hypothetical protein A2U01_0108432, partial [Trifolium medium]|nr:hypothetical protein [Trifolium medium]